MPTAGSIEKRVLFYRPGQHRKIVAVKWTRQKEKPDHFWPGSLFFDFSARGQSIREAEDF
jgi:hypothetical protein